MPVDWVVVGVDNGGTANNGTILDASGRFLFDRLVEVPSEVREGPDKVIAALVLSQYLDAGYALRLLESFPRGVGYLLKDRVSQVAVLIDAVERVVAGECVVDPSIVTRLVSRTGLARPLSVLTPRERDVLSLMAEGRTNSAIGQRLFLSEKTVEGNVRRIFDKLGLTDTPEDNRRVLAVLAFLRA